MFNKHSFWLFSFFVLTFQVGFAQFVENFDDGNFTQNPTWLGDQDIFIVNTDGLLQLNDVDVSKAEAYLSVNAPTGLEASWEFSVQLDFSPSGSNFGRIYLNANQADLTQSLDGYFIQIGGISGDQDAVELVKQNGTSETIILSGIAGGASNDPVELSVIVDRDNAGIWNLKVDYDDGQGFVEEGSIEDTDFPEGNYFGFVCNYTSSRIDAFFLDEIRIEPIFQDLDPPVFESLNILSNNQLLLSFNESLDFGALSNANFQLDNGLNIISIEPQTNPSEVLLNLSPSLSNGTTYTLQIQNVNDLEGNTLIEASNTFTYTETVLAGELDLLINEFMADPTPQVGLPNAEYIELYNNATVSFQLSDYTIASGNTPVVLPSFILEPNQYVLLTSDEETANFDPFGDVLGLSSFPSLTNSGDEIVIQDLDGNIIHQIFYTQDWYQDAEKDDGGYSIELINPTEACKGAANYRASNNLGGGTPAVVNSVLSNAADQTPPDLINLFTLNPNALVLTFDEPLTDFGAEEVLNYKLTKGLALASASLQTDESKVLLSLVDPMVVGEIYGLQYENIADCLGNSSSLSDTLFFALPELAQPGDLLINEILFNPVSGGVDFVEIYNPTDRVFNLADLEIANSDMAIDETEVIDIDFLLFPKSYACFTEDKSDILERYEVEDPNTIFQTNLPRFDDKSGNVTLLTQNNNVPLIIDLFDYLESMHTGFISDRNGVSLERISFDSPTNEAVNWTSGAQSTGFATPGYKNSQSLINLTVNQGELYDIVNSTFSPDQDGFKDFLQVNFKLDQTDYFATMVIYDSEGREIKKLLPYQTIAPSSSVVWDGTGTDDRVASMGIYILWIQMLTPDGEKREFKEPIVVARRLN